MNKKGGHVDWVISMGIFIVYIFALFILIRPGVRPIYRPVTLLNNLQENFEILDLDLDILRRIGDVQGEGRTVRVTGRVFRREGCGGPGDAGAGPGGVQADGGAV